MTNQTTDIDKLAQWYEANKEPFIRFLLRSYKTLGPDDAHDIYQQSVIELHHNIRTGSLPQLNYSLSIQLLIIGINKTNIFLNQDGIIYQNVENCKPENLDHLIGCGDNLYPNEIQQTVYNIEQPCRDILFGYYYDSFSANDIAERMGYKDMNEMRNMKHRCLKKVKNMLHSLVKGKPLNTDRK